MLAPSPVTVTWTIEQPPCKKVNPPLLYGTSLWNFNRFPMSDAVARWRICIWVKSKVRVEGASTCDVCIEMGKGHEIPQFCLDTHLDNLQKDRKRDKGRESKDPIFG